MRVVPRWVHGLAILTVLAALPLFFLGADVTTKGAGMIDQRSFVLFWEALGEMLRGGQSHAWVIEHLHRLAGWFIGLCGILLTASLWWKEPRSWVRWLGTLGLALIVVQGLLGIFRIQLHALMGPNIAWVHGSFAPVVLATLVLVGVVTSRRWVALLDGRQATLGAAASQRWRPSSSGTLALGTCAVIYAQLVIGGMVRHRDFFLGARLHLLLAFLVAGMVFWLAKRVRDSDANAGARAFSWVLLALLGVQLFLGIEAWLSRFNVGSQWNQEGWRQVQPLLFRPELFRTLHFVGGSLLLAACVALTACLYRPLREPAPRREETPSQEREEVLV